MLSVSTLLLVIIMVAFLMYFYHNFVIDDFDDDEFEARLMVLRKYLNNSRDGTPYPTEVGYVSDVDDHQYHVTYFSTANLTVTRHTTHDDREETFSFVDQTFNPVVVQPDTVVPLLLQTGGRSTSIASSISFHPTDDTKFVAHLDDGDQVMDCRTGVFDGQQCVTLPVCRQSDVNLPMTEERLNRLVYNNNTTQSFASVGGDDAGPAHASLYVRCDENAEPHVEQCPDGETFDGTRCVYDPSIETEQGVVTSFKRGTLGTIKFRQDVRTYGSDVSVTEEHSAGVGGEPVSQNTVNKITAIQKAINFNIDPGTKNQFKTSNDEVDIKEDFAIRFRSKRAERAIENGALMSKREKRAALGAKLLPELKKELEKSDVRNYKLQQTKMAFKNLAFDTVVAVASPPSSPPDSPFISPVNDNSTHSSLPCLKYGPGHTFVENTLSDNQYLECLDDSNLFLHTCTKRLQLGARYYCDKEDVCVAFEKGNGEIVHGERNDHVSFDTGRTVCRDYNVFEVVECDTGNFVSDLRFKHPLAVELHVSLPKEIYDNDADDCVPFRTTLVDIHRDTFKIDLDNPYKINFGTMAVGRVSKMDGVVRDATDNDLHSILTYARDLDEVAINPVNGVSIECTADVTVDMFSGALYTICSNGALVESGEMLPDQYFDVEEKQLARSPRYNGQCRIADNERYVDFAYRTVGGLECFYTSPINI
ncbi:VP91 [Betabaculovirus altermyunipunctae]|uniref:VP91 n=1 Tax=Betabaculovirus altermyunipunctae TaxID=3051996 RepID=A0A1S5YE70_9BBAC|nr:VP91 [Betabaculovirus altermyunipunctae]AQQ80375.1 VP91 [Betabaculovirus altermyunipunctae]